jgi:hypothetical protein
MCYSSYIASALTTAAATKFIVTKRSAICAKRTVRYLTLTCRFLVLCAQRHGASIGECDSRVCPAALCIAEGGVSVRDECVIREPVSALRGSPLRHSSDGGHSGHSVLAVCCEACEQAASVANREQCHRMNSLSSIRLTGTSLEFGIPATRFERRGGSKPSSGQMPSLRLPCDAEASAQN